MTRDDPLLAQIILGEQPEATATTRLVKVNEQLREFVRETRMPAYKARYLTEIIKDVTEIIPMIEAEMQEQVRRTKEGIMKRTKKTVHPSPEADMTQALNVSRLTVVESTDSIASCNGCGQQNYVRTADGCKPNSTRLWDLQTSPNGLQTYVMKYCRHCLSAIRDQIEDVVLKEDA